MSIKTVVQCLFRSSQHSPASCQMLFCQEKQYVDTGPWAWISLLRGSQPWRLQFDPWQQWRRKFSSPLSPILSPWVHHLSFLPRGLSTSFAPFLLLTTRSWILKMYPCLPPFSPLTIRTLSLLLSPSWVCLSANADCWPSNLHHLHLSFERPRTAGRGN